MELVDTSSSSALWAERFQSELTDPFELQEAVTGRIAASLHLQLLRAEHLRSIIERTTDPDAYDMRLRAMAHLIDKLTPENTLAARRDLEKSVALDPYSAAKLLVCTATSWMASTLGWVWWLKARDPAVMAP